MSNEELMALEVLPTGLTVEQLEDFALKHWIVSLQLQGLSASEAIARVGCDRSPQWATKWRRRFEEVGAAGLLDQRQFNGKDEETMTSQVKKIIMGIWHSTKAGSPAIANETAKVCNARGIPAPSASAVKEFLENLPEHIKLTRGGDFEEWDRQARPTLRQRLSRYANERFQADHTRIDIWAKVLRDDVFVPIQLWLTVLLDDFSRAIAGVALTEENANSWSITQALRHALLPKDEPGWVVHGKPEIFQCDRGADFMSHAIQTAMAVLKIEVDPDPPNYPNRKGKMERLFQTLDQSCLRLLPGHMARIGTSEGAAKKNLEKLLTPDQIEREIKRWIVDEYHQRTHSSTKRKPLELWEETVRLRVPSEDEVFRVLLRKEDEVRKVQGVINFEKNGDGGDYWCPELFELYHRGVRIAYNPEDMRRIVLHCEQTGEFLAEPWLLDHPDCPWSREDVVKERSAFKRGLAQRIQQNLAEIEALKAEAGLAEEWGEAREEVAEDEEPVEALEENPEDDEAEEILGELKRRRPDTNT